MSRVFEGETGEFPTERASNAENLCIWWRHYLFKWFALIALKDIVPFIRIYPDYSITFVSPFFLMTTQRFSNKIYSIFRSCLSEKIYSNVLDYFDGMKIMHPWPSWTMTQLCKSLVIYVLFLWEQGIFSGRFGVAAIFILLLHRRWQKPSDRHQLYFDPILPCRTEV